MNIEEQVEELCIKVQGGDTDARDELILLLEPYAKNIVKGVILKPAKGQLDHVKDDLIGDVVLHIVVVVAKIANGEVVDVRKWYRYLIRSMIISARDAVWSERLIPIDARTGRRMVRNDLPIPQCRAELPPELEIKAQEKVDIELWLDLEEACATSDQWQVIKLLAEGQSQREIVKTTKFTQEEVKNIVKRVAARLFDND